MCLDPQQDSMSEGLAETVICRWDQVPCNHMYPDNHVFSETINTGKCGWTDGWQSNRVH